MLKDLKEGLANRRKPDTTHVRRHFRVYTARGGELGDDKYERGNYLRPTGGVPHAEPTPADVVRFRDYVRAAVDHISAPLDALERVLALHPKFRTATVAQLRAAAFCPDTDVTPGSKLGDAPSMLAHIALGCSSLMMAIEQAVDCGLLPADPGATWIHGVPEGWRGDEVGGRTINEALILLQQAHEARERLVPRDVPIRHCVSAPAGGLAVVEVLLGDPLQVTTNAPSTRDQARDNVLREAAARDRARFAAIDGALAESGSTTINHTYQPG